MSKDLKEFLEVVLGLIAYAIIGGVVAGLTKIIWHDPISDGVAVMLIGALWPLVALADIVKLVFSAF